MKSEKCGLMAVLVTAAVALAAPVPAGAQVERVVVKVAEARCFS
jgi:hypothetical protein